MLTKSSSGLAISEPLQVNTVVWVQSLPEEETGPTRRILEDLSTAAGFPVIQYSVHDTAELEAVFDEITARARSEGLRPILHVDAHGTAEEGLLLAPSGDRISWSNIIDHMRQLNVATENNLVCVFALCYGLHLYREVSLSQPVPAYFFIAPERKVTVGFLEQQTLEFYRAVNENANVTTSFEATLKDQMQFFHCQGVFFQTLVRYIKQHCKGRAKGERLERMVSAVLERDGISEPTADQLRQIRQDIKAALKPDQSVVDYFASRFLIGRPAAFDYQIVKEFLDRQSQ